MNRIYTLVFNTSLGIVQVVSELVGRHGARLSAGARRRLPAPSALAAAVAAACVRSGSGMAGARLAMLGLALVAGEAWADASGTYPVPDGDGSYQDTSLVLTSEVAGQTDDDGDVIDGKRIGVIATDGSSDYLVRDIAGIGQTLLVAGDGSSGVSGDDASTQAQSVTVVGYYLYAGGGVSQTLSTDVSYDAAAGQWVDGSGQAVQVARIAYGSTGTDEDGNPTVSVAGAVDVAVKLPADDDGDDGDDGGYAAGSRVSIDRSGAKGKNGRTGALFVPAKAGSDGARGPDIVANAATDAGLDVQGTSTIAPGHAGIFVSSTGGKGGDGGDIWLSASKAKPGGNGGSGGNVTVTVSGHGTIVTSADGNTPAPGIAVQSKSGQGGEGGSSYAGGGAAGGGGTKTAGNVSLTTSANVETSGDNSAALLVQSLGGGGGKGGDSFGLFPTSGASGGAGGDAGAVSVDNSGNLTTHGNDSAGINAQSIGGTGGNGGTTVAIVVLGSDDTSIGGNGGTVDVTNSGVIKTAGDGSDGISTQSIGGGGGRTGTAVGIVTLGGSSAAGGNAGAVAVHNSGTIITGGEAANGILAQSIGGGGGKGGTHVGAVALGSAGGAGGNAGQVAVDNTATLLTGGDHSAAILAQSIGGGGGAGGATGGLVALGAAGAAGGNAGAVRVENSGALQTSGVQADGIVAQSIGGGGGSGSSAGGLVALGGSGGKGGTADAVEVVNSGDIVIQGEGGAAIVAQSIGGGGGRGGSAGGLVSLAGKGGSGGDAGCDTENLCSSIGGSADERDDGHAVSVENGGSLQTAGDYGYGILAQSIGGGGGDGGNAGAAFLSIGGSGGKGGAGGDVAIANVGDIITSGAHADGILAQSIGGGGGNGGLAVSAAPFVAVALGGSGGEGGDGGKVSATLGQGAALPTIITGGDNAAGIKLETVGGGGGNGGTAAAASIGPGLPLSVSFSQGGSGGNGGDGGLVTVQGNARIATSGDNADALYLSTIGGGGGSGGNAVGVSLAASIGGSSLNFNSSKGGSGGDGGRGGDIEMDTGDDADGVLQTSGDFSAGLLAQTIGGGGGSGGDTVAVTGTVGSAYSLAYTSALGGTAGKGGAGGDIDLSYNGAIATGIEAGQADGSDGFGSTGALIQSIGGGGGSGGSVISAQAGLSLAGLNVNQTLGGSGGDGGRGGTIDATLGGSIQTGGDNAGGAVIQSVGGGGGNSGNKIQASLQAGLASGSLSLGIGGTSAGAGNDGGAVTATVAADVATQGNQSDAVLIQSVGGGGGNGGYTIDAGASVGVAAAVSGTLSMGASGGDGGDGGTVDATIVGNLSSLGDQSRGAVVQSVGGGGGNGGFDIAAQLNISANPFAGVSAGVTMGIGGSAGDGGDGGDVGASLTGASVTQGPQSDAYVVQSLGGGGGNGGFAVAGGLAVSVAAAATGALQAAIGIGGSGGSGGDAGNATGTLAGDIGTSGDQSTGMLVQSVGGGGGNGGFTVGGSLSIAQGAAGNASIGIGGVGGSGGVAGQASGHLADGDVVTEGDDSAGVVVQSIGGGGGNGGFNVAGGASLAGEGAAGASVGIGGTGGSGGTADLASASLERVHVQTAGENATGVLVQSVGGGGGNGGFNVAGSVSAASTGAAAVAVGIGGNGGSGGVAGDAAATFEDGWVHTYGGNAGGVVVQSVGGGGGNGGFNVGAGVAVSQVAGTVGVGIGGSGGSGGRGGSADAVVRTDVLTEGDDATGVLVQSVGGGGGNGGFNIAGGAAVASTGAVGVSVGLGGTGGDGGSAGAASLDKQGLTYTRGDGSAALVAQSIGGGGGNGGFNVSGTLAASAGVGGSVAVGIGGNGGSGASAGTVVLTQQGQVQTEGADAVGILAQSVGGGGGNGGFNVSGGISAGAEGGAAVSVGLGGSGGDGGSAGSVTLDSTGAVVTSGAGSTGIVAQSVGGGGGNGAFNVSGGVQVSGGESLSVSVGLGGRGGSGGSGGDVHASAVAAAPDGSGNDGLAVATLGDGAAGLVAQSIGGGGGNGGFNVTGALTASGGAGGSVSVGLGGDGGDGSSAGDVDGFTSGLVSTDGAGSDGVVLQSIGGGGGNGGFNVAGAATVTGSSGGSVNVGLGGNGGAGGTSGNVTGSINATDLRDGYAVMTQGDAASAVVAQSLAGGGGNGGFNVAGALTVSNGNSASIGVGIGGRGGTGNDAGDVDVDVDGNIQTGGDGAQGIVLQSIGGGGGNGGFNVAGALNVAQSNGGSIAVGVGGSGGDGGDGGNVSGTLAGNVATAGDDAGAVTYQSIGGGGGNGGMTISGSLAASGNGSGNVAASIGVGGSGGSGGRGGAVSAALEGDLLTGGDNAYGGLFQSIGGGGGNGGMTVSGGLTVSAEAENQLAVSVGVGGSGGSGGGAGAVSVVHAGNVVTTGADAEGLVLQSLGGGGGNGGLTVSGAGGLSLGEGSKNLAVAVGIGGNGGSGGSAGDVTGALQGDYLTLGDGSTAVLAQSLGGGGGNGGITITGGIAASLGDNGAASIGIGGTGGSGNTAGDVQLNLAGNVVTQGANADAIVAQSIGGGGGNGGLNVAGALALGDSKNGTVAVGIGGKGGEGAVAGDVDVQASGTVAATGGHGADITLGDGGNFKVAATDLANGSNGIVAQSIGGGGGNGGINIQGGLSVDPTSVFGSDDAEDTAGTGGTGAGSQASSGGSGSDESTSVGIVFGIGGNGGTGGDAGDVGVAVAGQDDYVLAVGDEKSAILAQSIGGGGGNGGINIGAAISTGSSITVGLGGNGANGGAGGDVGVDAATDVFAYGDHARGILAQSIGGGGGAGGINIGATLSKPSSDDSVSLVVGLGGAGGTGNTAGAVDVTQQGNVNVVGSFASAILAQSIGGGGGAGGQNISASAAEGEQMLAVSAGVGGDGAEGGDAGAVSVASDGNLYVNANGEAAGEGEGGTGILAQSIGGGGGAGGGTVSGLYSSATVPITLGVGGNGGSGGNAGTVSVTRGNAADWGTDVVPASSLYIGGDNATGILAQSIGGGGGNGGGTLVLEKYASANASGGDGATAEAGSGTGTGTGAGTGSGSGDEDTSVAASLQIGGSGAGAGSGAAVDVANVGNVYTSGAHSSAIVAQSIGGGGGNAGQNVRKASGMDDVDVGLSISLGGATGAAGTGGDVQVRSQGDLVTAGDYAYGIQAQSIGGGGGNAAVDDLGDGLGSNSLSFSLGRQGGSGGEGGRVAVQLQQGIVQTAGQGATALIAQSIGGGGGTSSSTSLDVAIAGGSDSTGGSDEAGTTDGSATAATGEDPQDKQQALSVGLSLGIAGGTGAAGGEVAVDTAAGAVILTQGDDARGILAQSIGGGGGTGGSASSSSSDASVSLNLALGGAGGEGAGGGSVAVRQGGTLETHGDNADGLLAQSVGGGGGVAGSASATSANEQKEDGKNGGEDQAALAQQDEGQQDASQITTAVGVNLALGGQGGEGAVGGAVTVANTGSILTWGTDSVGINAQSVGGGGGVGGASSAKDEVSTSNDLTLVMGNIAVSGAGGQGAAGGSVSVDNAGLVQTAGERAYGIGAMSVGGGGGSGGVSAVESSIATGDEGTGSTSLSLSLALGGSGGSGGSGGEVSVRNVAVAAGDAAPVVHTLSDQAYGIYARSIGGGGGDGAMTSSRSSQEGAGTALELGLALGASGGNGNTGGNVDIVNGGYVLTAGDAAHAVYGQSIGGGGGAAGVTVTGAANTGDGSKTLALALGGSGGSGAAAGEVSITNTGWIGTTGARAYGIFAQSVGGGGGDTALTLASRDAADAQDDDAGDEGGSGKSEGDATESQASGGAMQLSLALGGSGGDGGRGGAVTVVNRSVDGIADSGVIVTSGDSAHGIFAQSVGGGGGSADLAVANAGSADASAVSLNLALGGNGGSGNAGGDVSVVNDGIIQTGGAAAYGILAQSIGGGGGDGGQSVAIANLDLTGMAGALVSDPQQLFSQSTDLVMAVGGSGGSGGDGGDVSVVNNGRIVTTGDGADGIVAQSIGGGGGNSRLGFLSADGGESGISLYGNLASMLGASGATGGQAGAVSVANNGSISVSGLGAVAIRTQAINGGGGVLDQHYAGVDLSAAESGSDDDDGTAAKVTSAISTLLGSIGTSDSAGGDVATTSTGDYSASGAFSLGDLTQSIGGGGGSGLIDTSLLEQAGSLSPFSLLSLPVSPLAEAVSQVLVKQIVLGAVDGSGNAGGDVQASHAGTIVLDGDYGVASLQQTIGGGGGNQSDLSQGSGAVVQASLALGATQAGASAGGALDYRQQGDVVVAGQDAQGLALQSIGGGGGWANEVFEGGLSGQVDATLGANGGSGLDGGAVSGTIEGTVADLADNSVAVIAQSIGAGGGQVVASGADAVSATLGGRGGAAGDGGAVTLAVQGSVFNAGGNSYGVVAQSIGGGGGFVMASGGATGGAFSDANQGNGGAIDVQVDGSVIGGQAASYGVLAQSLGGGGGWVAGGISGTAGGAGRGGAVAVAIDGDVLQTGDASVAVQAASDGGQGGGDIDVVLGGDARGGSGNGAGVVLEGGADNRILVQSSLSSVSAQAALGGYGNDLLDNLGTLYGNVDLGGGSNRLVNEAGASMVTWDHVALGTGTAVAALAADTGNTQVNHGDLYFGLRAPQFPIDLYAGEVFADTDADLDPTRNLLYGARVISQVALDGNFVQSASGALYMDVAFGTPASDRLAATGSAALAGMGYFTLTSLANADWLPVVTAPQGTRDDGFAMENSIALTYKAQYRGDGVYLSYDPAFEQAFLRPNQNALGVHMDSALLTGSSDGIGRLMALLGNLKAGQEGAYRAIFDMIDPDGLAAPLYTQVQVQRAFSGSLFGCAGRDSDGPSDGACAWGNVGDYNAQRDRTADDLPIALSGSYARFGFDGTLDTGWRLSTAFEFDRMSQIQVDAGNTEASSRGVNLGVGFEHEHDGAQTRLTLAGGWSRYASTRLSPVFDADAQAVSHPRTGYLTGSAGLGTVLAHGDWSLRPRVDARYTLLHYDGMREQGLGEIGYRAQAHDQSLFSVVPSVRFAFDHDIRDGAVGLSSTVSYEVSTRDAVNLPLRFIGANDASAPADVQVPVASPYLRWSSRLYYQRDGVSIGLDYLSEHGSRIGGRTYGLDVRVKF